MSSDVKTVTIRKVGSTAPATAPKATRKQPPPPDTRSHRTKTPKHGILKGGKTARKAPRFEAVRDPAKSPPLRKTNRLRILTEKGESTRRAKIAQDAKKRPIREIRETLRKHNLNVRDNTPEHLAREIYKDAQQAGMISPA